MPMTSISVSMSPRWPFSRLDGYAQRPSQTVLASFVSSATWKVASNCELGCLKGLSFVFLCWNRLSPKTRTSRNLLNLLKLNTFFQEEKNVLGRKADADQPTVPLWDSYILAILVHHNS